MYAASLHNDVRALMTKESTSVLDEDSQESIEAEQVKKIMEHSFSYASD
eukprot:gene14071-15146_t